MPTVEQQIKDLTARVQKLETALVKKKPNARANKDGEAKYTGATGGVRFLIDKGFFSSKKSLGEVRKAAAGHGYHYSAQAIDTALSRKSAGASSPLVALKEGGGKKYVRRK